MLRRLVILFVVLASAVTMGTVAAGLGDDLKATCEDGHVWEEVSRVEATCTQDGTIVKQCAECGLEQAEVISKLGHEVEVDGDSYVAPTCTTEGYVGDVVCTRKDCDYAVEGETIPALGHSYGALVEKVDATCSATGMKAYYECSVCHNVFDADKKETTKEALVIAINPEAHEWDNGTSTSATCTEAGVTIFTCEHNSNHTKQENTPALGHDYDSVVTEPTCTEAGYTTHTCSVCGDSYVDDEVNALGHDYEAVVTEPTCTEAGYTTYTCSVCGDSYVDDEVNALGHDYEAVVTDPTCTEAGYTTYTCSVCGDSYVDDEVSALGHTEAEAVRENVNDSTCSATGSYDSVVYCSVCNEELSRTNETIAKKDHTEAEAVRENVNDSTCTAEGSYDSVVYCSVCNEELSRLEDQVIAKKDHTEAEAVRENVNDSTCTAEGSYDSVVYCSVCNEELSRLEDQVIAKKDHTEAEAVRENVVDSTCTTAGSYDSVVYCSVCNEELSRLEDQIIAKLPHDTDEDGNCTDCPASVVDQEIVFNLGENSTANKEGSNAVSATYNAGTVNGYTLTLKNTSKIYNNCTDSTGDALLKAGASSTKGTFNIDVPEDITAVIFFVGQRAGKATSITINGTNYTITKNSANGEYNEIVVDTKTTKTIAFSSGTTGDKRCMINTIKFVKEGFCEHTNSTKGATVAPTCTAKGYTIYSCADCNNDYHWDFVDALGHTYGDLVAKVEATCTEDGMEAHYVCSVCGEFFDAEKNAVEESELVIDALGHAYGTLIEKVDATCSADGKEAHYVCSVCGEFFDAEKNAVEESELVIDALGHAYGTLIAKVEATCTADGKEAHYVCSVCGEFFDAEKNAVEESELVIDCPGHAYGTIIAEVPATCTSTGKQAYYKCSVCNELFDAEKNAVEEEDLVIGLKDHNLVEIPAVAPECKENGWTVGEKCSECGKITIAPTSVPATGCVDVDPKDNVCDVCGDVYCTHPEEKLTSVYTDPTCEADGYTTQTCECGYVNVVTDTDSKLGHAYGGLVAKVEATCTEDGMEAHYECSVCHKFFDEEKNEVEESSLVIGAPGHDYDAVVTDPTCEADGYTTYTCACGDSYVETDTDSKLGHTYGDLVAKVDETCTNDGKEAHYECSVCHKFFDAEKNEVAEDSLVIAGGHKYVGTECSECHAIKENKAVATFEFGANGAASNNDGTSKTSYSETNGGYTLTLTNMTNMYTGARDDKGNSTIKGGTSSAKGSFGFTVPEDVTSVIIHIAKYGSDSTNVIINGTTYTLSKMENNGEYDAIEINTTSTKTVTVEASAASKKRFMVNTIVFNKLVECAHEGKTATHQDATCTVAGFNGFKCEACGHAWTTEVLEAPGHNMAYTPAKENNCKEVGNIAYYYCSGCEGYFADDKGQNAIVGEVTIPADPTKHVDTNDDGICDVEGCGANVCDHPEEKVTKVVTAPTCTAKGFTTYTCECGYEWEADEVEEKGHSETEFTYQVDAQDTTKHNKLCGDCGVNLATEDHTYTDGVCEYCEHEEPVAPATVTVNMSTFSAISGNVGGDSNVTYACAKGGGTTNPAVNSGVIRLYQNSAGTGGGYVTISAVTGYKLQSVTIGSSMKTTVSYTLDEETQKSTSESLAANGKYTVSDLSNDSITFYCMGTTSSTRLYLNYIEVTYVKA